jgi:nicotinate-nucleotide adenylyltransferase
VTESRRLAVAPKYRPLGLFGGRFDPVHRAHIVMATAVADELNLDEVRWIVTGDPVHKPVIASADDRLAMTKLALHESGDTRMVADDREVIAAKNGGSSLTADTVLSLQRDYPGRKLIWILGEDQLQNFLSWSRWQWLVHQADLAVCTRPNTISKGVSEVLISEGAEIRWVKVVPDEVSSTSIRDRIRLGNNVDEMLPRSVCEYISANRLYTS